MTCRTYSDCVRSPSHPKATSGYRRPSGRIVPLFAAILIHAMAVLAVLFALARSPVVPPSSEALAVSLLTEQPDASGNPLKHEQPVASPARTSASPKHGRTRPAAPALSRTITSTAKTSGTSHDGAIMNSTSARRGITSTIAPDNVAAARISGDPSAGSGVSIPARYAAGNRKPAYPLLARRNDEQGTCRPASSGAGRRQCRRGHCQALERLTAPGRIGTLGSRKLALSACVQKQCGNRGVVSGRRSVYT